MNLFIRQRWIISTACFFCLTFVSGVALRHRWYNTRVLCVLFAVVLLSILMFDTTSVFAATKTWDGGGDGVNWNSANNWNTNGVPAAGDNAFIPAGFTVIVSANATINSIIFSSSNNPATRILTVNSGVVLTVTSGITLQNDNKTSMSAEIAGAGTINCASVRVGGTTTSLSGDATTTLTSTISTLSISGNLRLDGEDNGSNDNNSVLNLNSGSVNVGGTVNLIAEFGSTATLTLANGAQTGTLTLSGASPFSTIDADETFTANGTEATVNYSSTGAQTVNPIIYTNLTLSGSGVKTTTGVTVNGKLSMQGTTSVSAVPTYGSSASLEYKGISVQTTGVEFPTIMNNTVIIDNINGVTLNESKTINDTLIFNNGKLETGPNNVVSGTTGSISGEGAGRYLVGDITISRIVGTGTIDNLGGVGFSVLDSGDDLGTVSVNRISGSAGIISVGGNQGIARKWIIASTNPPASGRSISFSWVSDDDNGIDLVHALVFRSPDGNEPWNPVGIPQDVSSTRTITVTTNTFSTWTVADEDSPLPVELISFTASLQGKSVILNWATKTEVQNYGFEIERLKDYSGNDGKRLNDWEKIGFVQGQGNSNVPKGYSFTDNNLLFGEYYYRLKQIGTDGSYKYSSEVEIATGKIPEGFVLEQNYPNPFNPNTAIRFAVNETSPALLKVYDVLGNEVITLFNETAEAGKYYYLDFDASRYSSGIYYYSLSAGNYRDIKKMMLVK